MNSESTKSERIQQIQEIDKFIECCETKFTDLLNNFGWSIENLEKEQSNGDPSKSKQARPHIKEENEESPSSYDLLTTEEKLNRYEEAVKSSMKGSINLFNDPTLNLPSTSTQVKQTTSLMDMKKLKRDLKRRRIKYRTTKTAPLTFTEELRELINLQMEIVAGNKLD